MAFNGFDDGGGEQPQGNEGGVVNNAQSSPATTVEGFVASTLNQNQAIVFAEKHDSKGLDELYGDPDFYEGMKQGGAQNLLLEYPQRYNELFTAYANRDAEYFSVENPEDVTIDRFVDEFKFVHTGAKDPETGNLDHARNLELKLRTGVVIDLAKEQGIKVHAIDQNNPIKTIYREANDRQVEELKEILKEKGISEEDIANDPDLYGRNGLYEEPYSDRDLLKESVNRKFFTEDELKKSAEIGIEAGVQGRVERDGSDWKRYIDENIPEGEKNVAIVGKKHAHDPSGNGIDEILGGDEKVATIDLVDTEKDISVDGKDAPHATIVLDKGVVIPHEKMEGVGYKTDQAVEMSDFGIQEEDKEAILNAVPMPKQSDPEQEIKNDSVSIQDDYSEEQATMMYVAAAKTGPDTLVNEFAVSANDPTAQLEVSNDPVFAVEAPPNEYNAMTLG